MNRRWNSSIWVGFILVLAGLLSYIPFFVLFPVTRDFPLANLLLFGAGGVLLARGLKRAFGRSEIYRGRIAGPILAALSTIGVGLFGYGIFFQARQLPSSAAAPQLGQKAPDFTLSDQDGKPVRLAELLSSPLPGAASTSAKGALLIFYRGYW